MPVASVIRSLYQSQHSQLPNGISIVLPVSVFTISHICAADTASVLHGNGGTVCGGGDAVDGSHRSLCVWIRYLHHRHRYHQSNRHRTTAIRIAPATTTTTITITLATITATTLLPLPSIGATQ